MGQYLESPGTGDMLPNGQSKITVGKIIAISYREASRCDNAFSP